MPQLHPHFSTGEPCFCHWFKPSNAHLHKQAATWDEIRNFKKIRNNPKAQEVVEELAQRRYGEDERQLKWIPWLLEQVRKGHVQYNPGGSAWRTPFAYQTAAAGDGNTMTHELTRQKWQHMADWMNSNHPTRQGVDMQNVPIQDIHHRVDQWDQDLQNRKRELHANAGIPLHTFDDGWSIRELGPHELKNEGDIMGHCVGGYQDSVRNGNLRVLSLRDHKGEPHVTTGIQYNGRTGTPWVENHDTGQWEYDPTTHFGDDNGYIYQHHGKGNAAPKDEYNDRFRQYFETMPVEKRPLAEDYEAEEPYINDIDELKEYLDKHGADYQQTQLPTDVELDHLGLPMHDIDHRPEFDWDALHSDLVRMPYYSRDPTHNYDDSETLYHALRKWGDLDDYHKNILQPAEEKFYDTFDENYYNPYGPYHPDYKSPELLAHHPMNYEDSDWEEELERQGLPDTPETRAQYESDWEGAESDARDEAMGEWPEYQAINNMHEHLSPHYNPQTQKYENNYPPQVQQQAVAKTASSMHYHIDYNFPCHCPWGGDPEHVGHVKQAAKLDWLRDRKDMQDDDAKTFLDRLERLGYAEQADKLLPWIVREWRKGRLQNHPKYEGAEDMAVTYQNPGQYPYTHWFTAPQAAETQQHLEEMKKHKQGIDVMQHTVHELLPKIKAFKEFLLEKKRPHMGQIVHTFDDDEHNGWTMRRLQNQEEATLEGKDMGHCVGSYGSDIEKGNTLVYSLRDHNNHPHATVEVEPNVHSDAPVGSEYTIGPGSRVIQLQGKRNEPPLPEYTDLVNEFLDHHGVDPAESFEPWWDEYYTVPGAENVREYVGAWDGTGDGPEPPDDYYTACGDAEENGVEPPDLTYDDPDLRRVWQDHTTFHTGPDRHYWNRPYHFDPDEADNLFMAAFDQGHLPELVNHYKDWASSNEYDPDYAEHRTLNDWWNQRVKENTNPETGEWENPRYNPQGVGSYNDYSHYETALDRWWAQQQANYPQLPGEQWQAEGERPPLPESVRRGILSALDPASQEPLYYRWVFSPDTGEVELGHNEENHPAQVRYHKELAGQLNRPNLSHGYAYRLLGGWRLTDWEHKPIEDPFVSSQVMQALVGRTPFRDEDSWQPAEHDFERTHYGLPQPKTEDSS